MSDRVSLRLTAGVVSVSTSHGDTTAIGPIEAQDREWWQCLREYVPGSNAIPVVLGAPESYAVVLPHLPRSRRETDALIDRLAPIRRRYLTRTAPSEASDGTITVTIAHAERLRSLRAMFATNGAPPPLFFAADGISAFDQGDLPPDRATRITAVVVFASLLAIPVVISLGAAVLAHRIDRDIAALAVARDADVAARDAFGTLATTPTVAAQIAAVARRLPDEGMIVAIGDAGERRVSIAIDTPAADLSRRALERTLRDLREAARERTRDGYRIIYIGVPQ